MKPSIPSTLLDVYVEKRTQLLRFFTARLNSAEAAEDLLQDMYFKLVSGEAADVRNPAAYLYRLGTNLMLDRLRHQRRTLARDTAWMNLAGTRVADQQVDEAPDVDRTLAARQRLHMIVETIGELSEQTQRVFRLHKLEGFSHLEVAERLGISRSAVEKHVSAALRHLSGRLK